MRKAIRIPLSCLAGLLVLIPAYHLVENARGNHAWRVWQRGQEAAGVSFDLRSYAPPALADADNFAAAPRLAAAIAGRESLLPSVPSPWPMKGLGLWREGRPTDLGAFREAFPKGIEAGLAPYRETLEDLAQAARRPGCRVKFDYSGADPTFAIPAYLGLRAAARLLTLRAVFALRTGHPEAACQDVTTLLLFARQLEREPALISQLLRKALASMALEPLWEGFENHAWTAAQLTALEAELGRTEFLASTARSWRFEQAYSSIPYLQIAALPAWSPAWFPMERETPSPLPPSRLETLLRRLTMPRGWVLQNAVRGDRARFALLTGFLDPQRHRVDARGQDAALAAWPKPGHGPYTFMTTSMVQVLATQNIHTAQIQAAYDQARIACRLERVRLASGAYPERLEALGAGLPTDLIDGQPMRYRRTPEGGYLLYSLGWNGVDDQGRPGQGKDIEYLRDGDWVWMVHR